MRKHGRSPLINAAPLSTPHYRRHVTRFDMVCSFLMYTNEFPPQTMVTFWAYSRRLPLGLVSARGSNIRSKRFCPFNESTMQYTLGWQCGSHILEQLTSPHRAFFCRACMLGRPLAHVILDMYDVYLDWRPVTYPSRDEGHAAPTYK